MQSSSIISSTQAVATALVADEPTSLQINLDEFEDSNLATNDELLESVNQFQTMMDEFDDEIGLVLFRINDFDLLVKALPEDIETSESKEFNFKVYSIKKNLMEKHAHYLGIYNQQIKNYLEQKQSFDAMLISKDPLGVIKDVVPNKKDIQPKISKWLNQSSEKIKTKLSVLKTILEKSNTAYIELAKLYKNSVLITIEQAQKERAEKIAKLSDEYTQTKQNFEELREEYQFESDSAKQSLDALRLEGLTRKQFHLINTSLNNLNQQIIRLDGLIDNVQYQELQLHLNNKINFTDAATSLDKFKKDLNNAADAIENTNTLLKNQMLLAQCQNITAKIYEELRSIVCFHPQFWNWKAKIGGTMKRLNFWGGDTTVVYDHKFRAPRHVKIIIDGLKDIADPSDPQGVLINILTRFNSAKAFTSKSNDVKSFYGIIASLSTALLDQNPEALNQQLDLLKGYKTNVVREWELRKKVNVNPFN